MACPKDSDMVCNFRAQGYEETRLLHATTAMVSMRFGRELTYKCRVVNVHALEGAGRCQRGRVLPEDGCVAAL